MSHELMSVAEALSRLLDGVQPTEAENVTIDEANWRVLAEDLSALRTQPPEAVSAMDGYAVRARDIETAPVVLSLVGQAAAGHPFRGIVGAGETVRIFTGGVLPDGSDTVILQENVTIPVDGKIATSHAEPVGRHVRPAGLDFRTGDKLLAAGTVLDGGAVCLAAAANHSTIAVHRLPRVGILATGDELLQPGSVPGPGQIIASNSYGIAALARRAGAIVFDLGIAADREDALSQALDRAVELNCDMLVTLGGASVGDHDLVRKVFVARGMVLDFWRIAMRPGKPLMHGKFNGMHILGLPGNPVSAMVCGHLFMMPMLEKWGGRPIVTDRMTAILDAPLGQNDRREDYLRSVAWRDGTGKMRVKAFDIQDSSMISTFANANALVIRPPHAPPATLGETVSIISLRPLPV